MLNTAGLPVCLPGRHGFPHLRVFLLVLQLVCFLPLNAQESHQTAEQVPAHEHRGILPQYSGEPPAVKLTARERNRLVSGYPVFKRSKAENPGRAITVFPVRATAERIWSVLRSFDSYPDWIREVKDVSVYRQEACRYHVMFRSESFLTGKVRWYAVHDFPCPGEDRNWGTWHLDYDYRSDLDDVVGYWRVDPSSEDGDVNYVTYSTRIKARQSVPAFIAYLLNRRGLRGAARWVTEQAESEVQNCCD